MPEIAADLLTLCKAVTAKRPKVVIEHLLQHGFITTEELKMTYGYNHPPRAIRDVREHGIPVETFRVTGADGRKIAAYRFGQLGQQPHLNKQAGRTVLSKQLKDALIAQHGSRCFIYREHMAANSLQIDHRVPYEIAGDHVPTEQNPADFMLLSASANRAKSWSCEQCPNWQQRKDPTVCQTCYWAFPENYTHIATLPLRRVDLLWQGDEISAYTQLETAAQAAGQAIPEFVKAVLARVLNSLE